MPMFGFDAAHTGFNPNEATIGPSNVAQLELAWGRSTGSGLIYGVNSINPVLTDDGVVLMSGSDYRLPAFDSTSGTRLWRSRIEATTLGASSDLVYVGNVGIEMPALRLSTGTVAWKAQVGQEVFAAPTVAGDLVYAGLNDPELVAVNAVGAYRTDSGGRRWAYQVTDPDGGATLALAHGIVYVATSDGNVYAFSPDGQYRWRTTVGSAWSAGISIANGVVYVATDKLYALGHAHGQVLWSAEHGHADAYGAPVVANGYVYLEGDNGTISAYHLPP